MARQLAEGACWGSMLASEEVWREQGQYDRHWVYNQGISMPWGPIISCYTLLPEGDAAYLKSASTTHPSPRGMLHTAQLRSMSALGQGTSKLPLRSACLELSMRVCMRSASLGCCSRCYVCVALFLLPALQPRCANITDTCGRAEHDRL